MPITFDSFPLLIAAGALSVLIILFAAFRRIPSGKLAILLGALGLIFLTLAAGGAGIQWRAASQVVVMVDLSPSTRGARFREHAERESRIAQLLGSTPFRVVYFAGTNVDDPGGSSSVPEEMPADRTVFDPPIADAIVLFSDAQFPLPASAPPTFPVIDVGLESPVDASVTRLEQSSDGSLIASLQNSGAKPRSVVWNDNSASPTELPTGSRVLEHLTTRPTDDSIFAGIRIVNDGDAGDLWKENDELSIEMLAPATTQRWWVGSNAPAEGWRAMAPNAMPTDVAAYLQPSVIVLSNISAAEIALGTQQSLAQYVRDLGGSLLIVGGDHAFAAGGYAGNVIDEISPLASSPPTPATHWILLADSSGSMAGTSTNDAKTRWDYAQNAVTSLLPSLPPEDLLSVGDFARALRWWSTGDSVRKSLARPLPPQPIAANGPTNLDAALQSILDQIPAGNTSPVEVMLLSDAQATLDDAAGIASKFTAKKIRLHLLALAPLDGDNVVRKLVAQTGGQVLAENDPRQWAASLHKLLQAASPDRLMRDSVNVRFDDFLAPLGSRETSQWNRTWLREGAQTLAQTNLQNEQVPMAAHWQRGTGRVAAIAYGADRDVVLAMADQIAQRPSDPRFSVSIQTGSQLIVSVDAFDGTEYLNGLPLTLEMSARPAAEKLATRLPIPQVAPGRYVLRIPSPRETAIATIRNGDVVIHRAAIAGRYAPEFDAIGNDHDMMNQLARRTGGQVIRPTMNGPIDFKFPTRRESLVSYLALAGAACLATAIISTLRGKTLL